MLMLINPFDGLGEEIIRLFLIIDSKIYWVFSELYNLYIDLASARIFNHNIFDIVIGNVYAIITVIALFIVAFMLLKSMVNIDDASKGTKTIKDLIIRIVKATFLICLSPFLFDLLFDVQSSILGYGSIQKMILGSFGAEYGSVVEVPKQVVELNEDGTVKYDENGNMIPVKVPKKCIDNPNSNDEECQDVFWCKEKDETTQKYYNCTPYIVYEKIDVTTEALKTRGNVMAFYVINGFMHPAEGYDINSVEVNASTEFGFDNGVKWAAIVAGVFAVAAIVVGIFGSFSSGGLSLVVSKIGFSTLVGLSAAAGGMTGYLANDIAATITASEFKWIDAVRLVVYSGDFDMIVPFAEAVVEGEMNYIPILSTIGAGFLAYMMFSFCLDLGVRAAKLLFYETMAPVSFLLSIIPGKEDLTNNWFKAVFTTWIEVFVRIFIIALTVLLISNLDFGVLNSFSPAASAILILGIITFAKQVPKALGDITGIKSEGIKLGIKEKLMDGGVGALLTAGAAVGGGLTAGLRNTINGWKRTEGGGLKKLGGALKSGIAGTVSGAARAGKAGWGAKSFKDMKDAASKGASGATARRDKRAAYKASHGGTWYGAFDGHVADAFRSIGEFAGVGMNDTELGYYTTAAQMTDSILSMSEGTYKKKQEYIEQSAKAKAAMSQFTVLNEGNKLDTLETEIRELTLSKKGKNARECKKIDAQIFAKSQELSKLNQAKQVADNEARILKQLQVDMSYTKRDVIALAATKLSVDQKSNYSGDDKLRSVYKDAIDKAFSGKELTENDKKIHSALLSGSEIKEEWITKENIIILQDAIDKANIARQHEKSLKEREHVVKTGNRSTDSNNK